MKTEISKNTGGKKSGRTSSDVAREDSKTPAGGAQDKGGPLDLPIDLIDEDPRQPRTEDNPGFSQASLSELSASILLRRVKTPISVRENPDAPGRFIINHGARRFRSSKLAGNATIPGFIDNDYNEADQVVENLQRNALTPREVADFIGRELARGVKRGEIARTISKSPAFVTQHANLLDLPDPIAAAFSAGRARDVTVVSELLTAFKRNVKEVTEWLENEKQEITRTSVKSLRDFLDRKRKHDADDDYFLLAGGDSDRAGMGANERAGPHRTEVGRTRRHVLQVRHNRRLGQLLLNRRPTTEGSAWLRYDDDDEVAEVSLSKVQLVALLPE